MLYIAFTVVYFPLEGLGGRNKVEVVSGTRSSWGIFGSALHVFSVFFFGLLDWMVFIRHPAHVRWQGFPWPQGERQPIVKVKPAELFLNTKPLNFTSCTCPNYWSGYFALEQSRPGSVRPTEKWVDKLQKEFFNKVARGKWVNFLCYMWSLLTSF